jgi:hypothetical protein
MTTLAVNRNIAAPREVVFRHLSDFRNAPARVSGIKRVEMLTDGPVGKGTRFKETRIMMGREATETMEVLEFNPPVGYVLGAESCGCRYRSEFRLTHSGSGTDVQMTFDATPLTFFAKVMSFLMRPMMKSCMKLIAKDLDDIKSSIESGGSASGRESAHPA